MLKIGMLTSWNTQCGIAEYSRYLVKALQKRDDVEVTVLGSRNYDWRSVAEHEDYVVPTFDVELWNTGGHKALDIEKVKGFDVVHIQYEVVLYNQEALKTMLGYREPVWALTYHDNCIPPDFPYQQFDLLYTHREDFGFGEGYLLPMGIENRTPIIKTFGLGRSREDIITQICLNNGWHFEKSFGEQSWRTQEELYAWLRDSDAIVLYYDDVEMAGTSIAARVAVSTRRPVFINDVTWFRGFDPRETPNLHVVKHAEDLEEALQQELTNPYIQNYSWDNIAAWLVEDYKECLEFKITNVT